MAVWTIALSVPVTTDSVAILGFIILISKRRNTFPYTKRLTWRNHCRQIAPSYHRQMMVDMQEGHLLRFLAQHKDQRFDQIGDLVQQIHFIEMQHHRRGTDAVPDQWVILQH